MGTLRIITLTNTDPRFYPLLGPYLARRAIIQAVGGPLYDDDGKIWFVAVEDHNVAGFSAIQFRADEAHFCSDYVRPEYRRQGIHRRFISERLAYVAGQVKRATATATVQGLLSYRQHGFVAEAKKRPMKNFTHLEKIL